MKGKGGLAVRASFRWNSVVNITVMSDVTCILEAAQQADPTAADQLLPLVYNELRRLAAHRMANEAAGQTLQATALVHEAWLRLTGNADVKWDGRTRFFGAAAEAMRRILIERAPQTRRPPRRRSAAGGYSGGGPGLSSG